MWRGQIAPLSKSHKLCALGHASHGQSSSPEDQSLYSEEATVADMAALLDAVGAKTAIVGGLSLGGYMSLAFNATHPERVKASLIIDNRPRLQERRTARRLERQRAQDRRQFEKNGLKSLQSGSAERATAAHKDAMGLARAARGMLTQKNARVNQLAARHQGAVDCRSR